MGAQAEDQEVGAPAEVEEVEVVGRAAAAADQEEVAVVGLQGAAPQELVQQEAVAEEAMVA